MFSDVAATEVRGSDENETERAVSPTLLCLNLRREGRRFPDQHRTVMGEGKTFFLCVLLIIQTSQRIRHELRFLSGIRIFR